MHVQSKSVFLANTQILDQIQHQLQQANTHSCLPSWLIGATERYLPINAMLDLYQGTCQQSTGKQVCRTSCA